MKKNPKIRYNEGEYLAIWITGDTTQYIAEVVQSEPLCLKVTEQGPYSSLRDEDFIIHLRDTIKLQSIDEDVQTATLKERADRGTPFISGLKSLGVTDNKLHSILPIK